MEWEKLKKCLSEYNTVLTKCDFKEAVTTSMPRTYLLGNGDIAVISSGNKTTKEYLLAKGDFWSCGSLKKDAVMNEHPKRVTSLPIGKIQIKNLSTVKSFSESIDITTATLTSVYDDVTVTAFCYSDDNAILLRLLSKTDRAVEFSIKTNDNRRQYPARTVERNGEFYVTRKSANYAKLNPLAWTSEVAVTSRGKDLSNPIVKGSKVAFSVQLHKNEPCDIFVGIGGGGKVYNYNGTLQKVEPCEQADCVLKEIDFDAVFKNHCKWWENYWTRSYMFVSDFEMEQYYYGSLYIMACTSRDGKLAPGLYGNFITTDKPRWNGDFHMNYNFIAPFYGMYKANRAEFAKPLKDPIIDFIPEGKRRAKKDLMKISSKYIKGKGDFPGRKDLHSGIDNAVLYPVALGPYGVYAWNQGGGYLSQMNDCAFTCMGLTAYYFYTLDCKYLNEIAELLLLNVNFFKAWSEKEDLPNGSYRYNFWSGAHEGTLEMNSPLVTASIKNILACLLDGAERKYLDLPKEKVAELREFFEHLPAYPVKKYRRTVSSDETKVISLGEKGRVFLEGAATVALEFIHPGEDMNFNTDPEIKEAARNVVSLHKSTDSEIFRQVNNLPKIFIHAIRADYDPNAIIAEFKNLYNKDFVYNYSVRDHNETHGIEKAGGIEFINSMLLDSDMKTVKVFPNFPKERGGEFYKMLARGAFEVSSRYTPENGVEFVEISSLVQDEISLVNPFENAVVKDEGGNAVPFEDKNGVITFKANHREVYRVENV